VASDINFMTDREQQPQAAIVQSRRRLEAFPSRASDVLCSESMISVELNGEYAGSFRSIGDSLPQAATGWAYMYRFIRNPERIDHVHVTTGRVALMTSDGVDIRQHRNNLENQFFTPAMGRIQPLPTPSTAWEPGDILELAGDVGRLAFEHDADLGTIHAGLVNSEGEVVVLCRDFEPELAVATAIGWLIEQPEDESAMLITRGVVSHSVVDVCCRIGIGLIISAAMPTRQAWSLSKQAGVTLVGMVESRRPGILFNAGHIDAELPDLK